MTRSGETYAQEVLDLFNLNNTLSEFNSPTYAGVSIYALTLWAKYMPQDSVMGREGPRMIRQVWEYTASVYNPAMRNVAGPWDRSYGYDMNKYVAIIGIQLWSLLGKDQAYGENSQVWSLTHADDFEYAPLIAVLSPYHDSLIPESTIKLLKSTCDRTVKRSAFAPPHDLVPRNVTTWMSRNLTIGAESFKQDVLGGVRQDNTQWNPAVVQWLRSDDSVGYMTVRATEFAMQAEVEAGSLSLTYPQGNSSSSFTFLISSNPLGQKRDITDVSDISGLNVEVGGTIQKKPLVGFCGLVGGTCTTNQ